MKVQRVPVLATSVVSILNFLLLVAISFDAVAQSMAGMPTQEDADSLFQAIDDHDLDAVRELYARNTNVLNDAYYRAVGMGHYPLLEAAAEGQPEIVTFLLAHGTGVNAEGDISNVTPGNSRKSALELAAERGHVEICELLLKAGANPNHRSEWGDPMHSVFNPIYGHTNTDAIVRLLLDYGANPFTEFGYYRDTAISLNISHADGKLVSRMLDASRARSNVPARSGQAGSDLPLNLQMTRFIAVNGPAVLAMALNRGELEAAQALLRAGASAKSIAPSGYTLMQEFALGARTVAQGKPARGEPWWRQPATEAFETDRLQQILQLLITNGADYDVFSATALGDLERARRVLATNSTVIQARDHEGATVLHWSVLTDQQQLTSFWLESGASPSVTNSAGQTPLYLAAALGLAEQTKLLLAARAPASIRDTNGWTALDVAIKSNQTATIRLLLSEDKAAPRPERGIALPIHQAAESGNLALLDELLLSTKDIEARNELGLTPLQVAVGNGHLAAAGMLVDKHADLNARDPDGNTALHRVLLNGGQLVIHDRPPTNWFYPFGYNPRQERFVRYLGADPYQRQPNAVIQAASFLLACGADVHATNDVGQTVLRLAISGKAMERLPMFDDDFETLLRLLVFAGEDLNQPLDAQGDTALHLLANTMVADQMKGLIAMGANVNATNKLGQTPLHKAAEKIPSWDLSEEGNGEPFQLLVKSGANVNAKDNQGRTPLDVVTTADHTFKREATELLIKAGAKSNEPDKKGMTPLHLLLASHEPFIAGNVQSLLDGGANPNARDDLGRTPVHIALTGEWPWHGMEQNLKLLAKAGADFSAQDNEGKTPLHFLAALGGMRPLSAVQGVDQLFLDAKVDFNARDRDGNTPLHVAAKTGTSDVFEWLMKHGANLDLRNDAGESPRLIAARQSSAWTPGGPNRVETDLSEAARQGNTEAAIRILKADASLVNQTNPLGQSPLRAAALAHQTNMIAFLERHGAKWDAISAVLAGRADALTALLRKQPSIVRNPSNRQLLHLAAGLGDIPALRALVGARADVRTVDSLGLSPVGHALYRNRIAAADWLLQHGAKENLFDAVAGDDVGTASALLARDTSLVSSKGPAGLTPVHLAARLGRTNVLELLLDRGAPGAADGSSHFSGSPLHTAVQANEFAAADLLIRHGEDVEFSDSAGFAPLHWAALRGDEKMVAVLLQHRANPNAKVKPRDSSRPQLDLILIMQLNNGNFIGDTPLHLAALAGRTNVIDLLLKNGASINEPNAWGLTPLRAAMSFGGMTYINPFIIVLSRLSGLPEPWVPPQPEPLSEIIPRQNAAADLLKKHGASETDNLPSFH